MGDYFYTNDEYYNMIRLYFVHGQNEGIAAAQYALEYPYQRHPCRKTIARAHQRLRENGTLMPRPVNGRPRTTMTADVEEEVLARVAADPRTSTRQVAREMNISNSQVHGVLRKEKIHPYHFTRTQTLEPTDSEKRMEFCTKLIEATDDDPTFLRRIV